MKRLILLLLLGLFLVACSATTPAADPTLVNNEPAPELSGDVASVEPTAGSEPAVPTAVPTAGVEPTTEVEPTMATEPTEVPLTVTSEPGGMNGRNEDGTFYRGAPDAPVTIIEYSDFL